MTRTTLEISSDRGAGMLLVCRRRGKHGRSMSASAFLGQDALEQASLLNNLKRIVWHFVEGSK
jgi:hypothetical protein